MQLGNRSVVFDYRAELRVRYSVEVYFALMCSVFLCHVGVLSVPYDSDNRGVCERFEHFQFCSESEVGDEDGFCFARRQGAAEEVGVGVGVLPVGLPRSESLDERLGPDVLVVRSKRVGPHVLKEASEFSTSFLASTPELDVRDVDYGLDEVLHLVGESDLLYMVSLSDDSADGVFAGVRFTGYCDDRSCDVGKGKHHSSFSTVMVSTLVSVGGSSGTSMASSSSTSTGPG